MPIEKFPAGELKRIVVWGTYDISKPRVRNILASLPDESVVVDHINWDIWAGLPDKSRIASPFRWLVIIAKMIVVYPVLLFKYLRAPRHDLVVICYLGQLDVLVLWLFARLRGAPILLDLFLSLYDTIVRDRQMIGSSNPLAFMIRRAEWLSCRAADKIILDTQAHCRNIAVLHNLPESKFATIYVGAETEYFSRVPRSRKQNKETEIRVLFYGQFIPLHGIQTIVEAAIRTHDENIRWTVIGRGQTENEISAMIEGAECELQLEWLPWVRYEDLKKYIAKSDICLGIFGDSEKAANVIPNKVYQILAVGRSLITRDSPAIRELIQDSTPGVELVPAMNARALVEAVHILERDGFPMPPEYLAEFSSPNKLRQAMVAVIKEMRKSHG